MKICVYNSYTSIIILYILIAVYIFTQFIILKFLVYNIQNVFYEVQSELQPASSIKSKQKERAQHALTAALAAQFLISAFPAAYLPRFESSDERSSDPSNSSLGSSFLPPKSDPSIPIRPDPLLCAA